MNRADFLKALAGVSAYLSLVGSGRVLAAEPPPVDVTPPPAPGDAYSFRGRVTRVEHRVFDHHFRDDRRVLLELESEGVRVDVELIGTPETLAIKLREVVTITMRTSTPPGRYAVVSKPFARVDVGGVDVGDTLTELHVGQPHRGVFDLDGAV